MYLFIYLLIYSFIIDLLIYSTYSLIYLCIYVPEERLAEERVPNLFTYSFTHLFIYLLGRRRNNLARSLEYPDLPFATGPICLTLTYATLAEPNAAPTSL